MECSPAPLHVAALVVEHDEAIGLRHAVLVGIVKNDVVYTPLGEITGRTRPADASLRELAKGDGDLEDPRGGECAFSVCCCSQRL